MIYFGARYYSPVIGRFLTPDTIVQAPMNPQTLNRYSYCNNNPINLIDLDGHSWKSFWRKASQFVAITLGTAAGFINPYLGVAVYSAIAASGQSGNYMKNFAFNFASGVIGMQVGAFAGSMWTGSFSSGLAAAAVGGAAASASMAAFTGGNVGMAALAGFAGGAIGYTGGRVWQLGADAVAGGVASVIQGGDFGDGAANGAYSNMATTLGGMMAPMENLGDQDVQAGDAVMFKANSHGAALIGFLDGGIFTHAGTMVSKTELVEVGFWKTPAKITNINGIDNYAKRSAYVSTKFRGNQKVIGAALSMVNRDTVKSYGIGSGSKICSTACAASYSAGQKSWYGIDPNTQANVMGYNQFYISRAYGK